MIQSKYEFNLDASAMAGKLAYKLRAKRKDMWVNIAVPIAMIIMVCILIYDILNDNSFVLDIVLMGLLVAIEIMNLCMPILIFKNQKKYLKQIEALKSDYFISEYNKGVFKEKIYKDNKMLYFNEISIDKFFDFAEFDHYIVLIFNNYATLMFDLHNFEMGTKDELVEVLIKVKNIRLNSKKKK